MEECHEISQWPPIITDVMASAAHQMYQGIATGRAAMLESALAAEPNTELGMEVVAILTIILFSRCGDAVSKP
jgi:hypothetical protein